MRANGEKIPELLAGHRDSGECRVQMPPALHRALVIEAAESGVSLNRLAALKLAVS
ncbi:toxin-antitoxin system HicB family antitoxin [Pandoraea sp. NPDC087047]|uniref:toxin-antitoxin system HicB family antitoxin n=1 Tax=Pandoraea sp. NPDC087047 TaxID=3364390 RepID=UPI0038158E76